ncbi:MAG: reprolysin-like metallopeptidase, partial [Lysobacterales bacterium]
YFGNTSSVHAGLQSALDDANQALRNGGIQNVTFSPRGPELLPNPGIDFIYDEAPIVQALHRLAGVATAPPPVFYTFPGNVYVAARRDAMWADIVALARDDLSGQQTCGYSVVNRWVANNDYPREPGPDFEKFAYLVFDPGCGADRLNLAHELGHQLGMEHDPANYWAPGSLPSCPWSFAHKRSAGDPRFRFRTVTAYWQNIGHRPGPGDCGSDSNCPLIDSFSTPLLEWAGDPASGGPPPFGLQPVGTVSGAWPIGIASASHPNRPAHGVDTLRRIAPFAQDYRARPELIFANGFQ